MRFLEASASVSLCWGSFAPPGASSFALGGKGTKTPPNLRFGLPFLSSAAAHSVRESPRISARSLGRIGKMLYFASPALHVGVPAGLRRACAMRTRQEAQIRPHRAGGPVVSPENRALGGEPNEEDRRSRELWRRFDCHRPREVVGKMETARS